MANVGLGTVMYDILSNKEENHASRELQKLRAYERSQKMSAGPDGVFCQEGQSAEDEALLDL